MSRCWQIRGTRRTAKRRRRRCERSPTSSTGSCASITKAIFPLLAKSGLLEPPRAAGVRNIRARLAERGCEEIHGRRRTQIEQRQEPHRLPDRSVEISPLEAQHRRRRRDAADGRRRKGYAV